MKPRRHSYIDDDEDVFVYLTFVDEDQCRNFLHVEVIKDLPKQQRDEQLSRVGVRSSFGLNYDVVNEGALTLYVGNEQAEQQHDPMEDDGENVSRDEFEDLDNDMDLEVSREDVSRDKFEDVDNDMYLEVGQRMHDEYVELPRDSQDSQFITKWEDGMGLEVGQEFGNKEAVQDLVDRAAFQNCFGFAVVKSDRKLLVLKCRQVAC